VTGDRDCLPLPVTPVRRIPMHRLQKLYVTAGMVLYRTLDAIG
jgi:sarcosine oxidase